MSSGEPKNLMAATSNGGDFDIRIVSGNDRPVRKGDDEEDENDHATTTATTIENDDAHGRFKKIYNLNRFRSEENVRDCGRCMGNYFHRQCKNLGRSLTRRSYYAKMMRKRLPITEWLPKYKLKHNLLPDVMSGITVGILNIPQGLAYALLATLNPIYGLYVSFFPILVYTLLGTCRHLVIGGVAIVSLLSGSVINEMVNTHFHPHNQTNFTFPSSEEDQFRVSVASTLSLLVGFIMLFMGLIGLGSASSFFSDTFISGYTCASAIHVLTSQIKDLFGINNLTKFEGIFKIPKSLWEFILKIGHSNWITLLFSLFCMLILVVCKEITNPMIKKKLHVEFPSELVLIIAMTSVSYFFDLNQNFNVSILKSIPTGFPEPKFPETSLVLPLLKEAILIATISFSLSISLAALYSRKKRYKIDPTQELYALGFSNIFGSIFSCYPIAGSLSRTSVVANTGGKTQLAFVFSSSILAIVIMWLAPLFRTLPNLCLASIIIVALKGLIFQISDLFKLWKINKFEFVTWLLTFLSVVILDVDYGLFIGICTSIFTVLLRDQLSPIKMLSQSKDSSNYYEKDLLLNDYVQSEIEVNDTSIKIFKIEHSIYFANCQFFANKLYRMNGIVPSTHIKESVLHPSKHPETSSESSTSDNDDEDTSSRINSSMVINNEKSSAKTAAIKSGDFILDFSAVNYIDTNGVQTLEEIIEDFEHLGCFIYICQPQESFLRIIFNLNLVDKFEKHIFLSIDDALKHFNRK